MQSAISSRRSVWLIGEIMLQKEWITWEDLARALKDQGVRKQLIGQVLVGRGAVTRKQVIRALAIQCGLSFVELNKVFLDQTALRCITPQLAHQYRFVPLEKGKTYLRIAVCNPFNFFLKALLMRVVAVEKIEMVLATPEDIDETITRVYHQMKADESAA